MFDLVIPRDRTWSRHLAVGLSILSLLTLTLAFAKPKDQVSVPRERATVVVTIDVSLSMEAKDVDPNRLDAAKAGAGQFVTSLPPKFNVALVTFAGTATTLVPPTMDHGAVTAAIRSLRPRLRPRSVRGSIPRLPRWPRCRPTRTTLRLSRRPASSC
jgi:Ca-activated chloride channel homolog